MKTQTPTKQTSHRLAAVLAIATAFATTGAWAWDKYYWTGTTSADFNTPANWTTNHVDAALEAPGWRSGKDLYFETADIVSYRVDFGGNSYGRGPWNINAGTEAQPLEFYCENGSTTVSPDSTDKYHYASSLNIASTCDSWVWINGGQWDAFAGNVTIGSSDYAGHLLIGNDRGASTLFRIYDGNNFIVNQGSVVVSNATVKIGGQLTVGNTAGKLTSFDFYNSTMVVDDYFEVKNSATFNLCGGSITNTANYLTVDYSGEMTIRDGGRYSSQAQILVGSHSAGTLNIIDGGEAASGSMLTLGYYGSGSSGTVNIANGGILTVPYIYLRDANASATVALDGGTIRAAKDNERLIRSANNLQVTVGANGGTIDAAGYNVTIEEDLDNAAGATGAMTFKGGGTVTLNVAPAYSGVTTVEVGTTLVVPAAIAGDKLVFTIPSELADGVYTVVSISGDSQFADDVLSGKAEGFVLSGDKKKICYVKGMDTTKPIYIGTDGNLSEAGNWLDGTVPTGGTGDAQIFCATPATLTVGGTFAPYTITIPENSAVVTIGSGTLNVSTLTNAYKLAVASGATLAISGDLVGYAATNTPKPLLYSNEGTVTVGGTVRFRSSGTTSGNSTVSQYASANANTTPIIANGLAYHADSWSDYLVANLGSMNNGAGEWVIGAGGFTYPSSRNIDRSGFRATGSQSVTLHSSADWTLDESYRHMGRDLYIIDTANVTIDTTDWFDDTTPRTVTLKGFVNVTSSHATPLTVTGCGTVVFDTAAGSGDDTNKVNNVLAVTNGATLKVKAGKTIAGTGTISLAAGTTLALESTASTFTTPDIVPVTLPSEGAATINIDGTRLRSGEHVLCTLASVPENLDDHVTVTGTALNGRRYEVKAVEVTENEKTVTKLVLKIYPDGLMVIFK